MQQQQQQNNEMSVDECGDIVQSCMAHAEEMARPGTNIIMMGSYFKAAFQRDEKVRRFATVEQIRTAFYDMILWGIPTDNTHARLEGRGGKNPSVSYVVDTAGYMAILAALPNVLEAHTVSIFEGDEFEFPEMFAPIEQPPFKFKRAAGNKVRNNFIASIACVRIASERYWRTEILDAEEFNRREDAGQRKEGTITPYSMWTEQTARTKALKKLFENLLMNWSLRGLITVQNLIQECEGLEDVATEKIVGLAGIEKLPGDTDIPGHVYSAGDGEVHHVSSDEPPPGDEAHLKTEGQSIEQWLAEHDNPIEIFRWPDWIETFIKVHNSDLLMHELSQKYLDATTEKEIDDLGKTIGQMHKKNKVAEVDRVALLDIHKFNGNRVVKKLAAAKKKADKKNNKGKSK